MYIRNSFIFFHRAGWQNEVDVAPDGQYRSDGPTDPTESPCKIIPVTDDPSTATDGLAAAAPQKRTPVRPPPAPYVPVMTQGPYGVLLYYSAVYGLPPGRSVLSAGGPWSSGLVAVRGFGVFPKNWISAPVSELGIYKSSEEIIG